MFDHLHIKQYYIKDYDAYSSEFLLIKFKQNNGLWLLWLFMITNSVYFKQKTVFFAGGLSLNLTLDVQNNVKRCTQYVDR